MGDIGSRFVLSLSLSLNHSITFSVFLAVAVPMPVPVSVSGAVSRCGCGCWGGWGWVRGWVWVWCGCVFGCGVTWRGAVSAPMPGGSECAMSTDHCNRREDCGLDVRLHAIEPLPRAACHPKKKNLQNAPQPRSAVSGIRVRFRPTGMDRGVVAASSLGGMDRVVVAASSLEGMDRVVVAASSLEGMDCVVVAASSLAGIDPVHKQITSHRPPFYLLPGNRNLCR